MSRSESLIMQSQNTRFTSGAFNVQTRVKPAPKHNPFWRKDNAVPSPCVVVRYP